MSGWYVVDIESGANLAGPFPSEESCERWAERNGRDGDVRFDLLRFTEDED